MSRTELHPPGEDGKEQDKRTGVIFEDEDPILLHRKTENLGDIHTYKNG